MRTAKWRLLATEVSAMNHKGWEAESDNRESRRQGPWGLAGSSLVILLVVSFAAGNGWARDQIRGDASEKLGLTAAAAREHPTIIVIIHNNGQVPGGTLDDAKAATTRILALAGIKTTWQESPSPVTRSAGSTPFRRRAIGIEINIYLVPRAVAARMPSDKLCLGLSILPGGDKRGNTAYVVCDRVEELAGNEDAPAGQILGHAMAHEIGHLLLNSPAHSNVGIMQAEWRRKGQWQLMCAGRLLFTNEQSRQMRAEVRSRMGNQEPRRISALLPE